MRLAAREPEDERRREDRIDPGTRADECRGEDGEDDYADADRPLGQPLRLEPRHPALPKSPCGRNASTSASSANVNTIEYCVQQSLPVVGRYAAENMNTIP